MLQSSVCYSRRSVVISCGSEFEGRRLTRSGLSRLLGNESPSTNSEKPTENCSTISENDSSQSVAKISALKSQPKRVTRQSSRQKARSDLKVKLARIVKPRRSTKKFGNRRSSRKSVSSSRQVGKEMTSIKRRGEDIGQSNDVPELFQYLQLTLKKCDSGKQRL